MRRYDAIGYSEKKFIPAGSSGNFFNLHMYRHCEMHMRDEHEGPANQLKINQNLKKLVLLILHLSPRRPSFPMILLSYVTALLNSGVAIDGDTR